MFIFRAIQNSKDLKPIWISSNNITVKSIWYAYLNIWHLITEN